MERVSPKVNGYIGERFNWMAVEQVRLVSPLFHRLVSRLAQEQGPANELEITNGSVPADPRLHNDRALESSPLCLIGIVGQNCLQQEFSGEFFRQVNWLERS